MKKGNLNYKALRLKRNLVISIKSFCDASAVYKTISYRLASDLVRFYFYKETKKKQTELTKELQEKINSLVEGFLKKNKAI